MCNQYKINNNKYIRTNINFTKMIMLHLKIRKMKDFIVTLAKF